MALRLIELYLPESESESVRELIEEKKARGGPWTVAVDGERRLSRILVDAEASGELIDDIVQRWGGHDRFELQVLAVQTALPEEEEEEEVEEKKEPLVAGLSGAEEKATRAASISREELYEQVRVMAKPSRIFYVTVMLSTVVVAVGLWRDNAAVIIGAMVIAPLLGPNVAMALSVALGDDKLGRQALQVNFSGLAIALLITGAIGLLAPVDPTTPEIAARTSAHWTDIVLALAAGSAGALALTSGVPLALVGVMVAVALLPPTAVVGLMAGAGHWREAGTAALLVVINLLCVVLAGMATFRLQGVQPRTWWEADRARKRSRRAALLGGMILLLLAVLLALYAQ